MKNINTLFFICVLFLSALTVSAQEISIAEARDLNEGSEITISGVIINGGELGGIRYMQDATGGIGIYDTNYADDLMVGMQVRITGTTTSYNELFEIESLSSVEVLAENVTPEAPAVSITEAFNETYEGRLVMLENISFTDVTLAANNNTFIDGSGNYDITDGTNSGVLRVYWNTDVVATPMPTGTFNVMGIIGQYSPDGNPSEGYQFLVRSLTDFDGSTNINTPTFEAVKIATYPNPASDILTIELPANEQFTNINILNVNGQNIYKANISAAKFELNVSEWAAGIYFLQVDGKMAKSFAVAK
ncbi:MAG: T9SS type A sorting domain-containing protein [Chitinophagales bacterium]